MIEALVTVGLFFLTVGTLGLVRLPETLNRMHATSKASTLGVGFTLLAGAVKFYPNGVYLSAILAMFFMFLTAPTGAHLIARAAYRQDISNVVISKEVSGEEWKYKGKNHTLDEYEESPEVKSEKKKA